MAIYVTDEVLNGCMDMIREKLWHFQDEIDTAYDESADQENVPEGKPPNRSLSIALNLNLTNTKSKLKATNTITFTTKKVKEKTARIFDPGQKELFGNEQG